MISCQALGPVGLSVDGAPAPPELLSRKHLGLLVYLARSPRGRTLEHLIELLWPEKPEAAARHSLNEAIRVVRKCVGDNSVDTTEGQVRLAAGAVRLDVDQLEERARTGEWGDAARLIAGEFLEGFAIPGASGFEDWLTTERSRVRHLSVEVLVRYAEHLLRSGQATQAAGVSLRALELEPHSEPALRVVMRSLVLTGDRTAALERYDAFCVRSKEEMGASPDTETQSLVQQVRHERSIRPMIADKAGDRNDPRPPLVGREVELTRLVDAAAAACRERRACALILQGESGIGKTRLVEELLTRLRLDGVFVTAVRAIEADRLEEWSGVMALARGGLLQTPGGSSLPVGSLSEVIRAAADVQPLALAVDDAQWLDQSSMLALLAAVRDLATAPLILVLAADPQPGRTELDELRTRIGRDIAGVALRLAPLNSADLRALARRMLPRLDEIETERVVRRVATDSAGLPLLAVELLRAVALGLDLRATPGAWPEPLRTLDQILPGDLPDTVGAAIRMGFRRLSPAAQRALLAAAVLGERVGLEKLAHALGVEPAEAAMAADELEWHRWLVCDTRGYTFVARIVQQVVARDMLTPGQRQGLQAIGDAVSLPS